MSVESSSKSRRSDFIVLVVVIGLLGALVTPAIFTAREAARRNQCADNLRRISLGVINYTDTFQHFPASTVGSRKLPPEQRFSWFLPLWPFFEGKPPELQVNTNQAWDAEVKRSPQLRWVNSLEPEERLKAYPLHYIPIFSCPSASRNIRVQGVQVTQYAGMAGLGKNAAELADGEIGVGIWGYDRQIAVRGITDGTAQTMLFVETVRHFGPWFAGGPPTVRGLDPAVVPLVGAQGQFGGLHSTVTAAMADASVRQIELGIDATVLSALVTIAGND